MKKACEDVFMSITIDKICGRDSSPSNTETKPLEHVMAVTFRSDKELRVKEK